MPLLQLQRAMPTDIEPRNGSRMRRNEKEIQSRSEINRVLEQAAVCRIAFNDDPFPYIVPLNFVFSGECLYFHSARAGRKMKLIRENAKVCFEVDNQIGLKTGQQACQWGTRYESVIGEGLAIDIVDLDEKRSALQKLMQKYSSQSEWDIPADALHDVAIVRVDVQSIAGKQAF